MSTEVLLCLRNKAIDRVKLWFQTVDGESLSCDSTVHVQLKRVPEEDSDDLLLSVSCSCGKKAFKLVGLPEKLAPVYSDEGSDIVEVSGKCLTCRTSN